MTTNYAVRKEIIDTDAAKALFSQEFLVEAFEAGAHKPRGISEPGPSDGKLSSELIISITQECHQKLATACLAYLLVLELRNETPEDTSFVDLIRQIRDGANKITQAADTLTEQLVRHRIESDGVDEAEKIDSMRLHALVELAVALNGAFWEGGDIDGFKLKMYPDFSGNVAGLKASHGLSNCSKLADEADRLLTQYQQYAKRMRSQGRPALAMRPGNRPDQDRNAFIADLADIYQHGTGKRPSANRASGTSGHAASPFVRFVWRVFRELEIQSCALELSSEHKPPSIDVIKIVLKAIQAAAEQTEGRAHDQKPFPSV